MPILSQWLLIFSPIRYPLYILKGLNKSESTRRDGTRKGNWSGIGAAMGVALGHLAVGVTVGTGVGIAFGAAWSRNNKSK